MLRLHNDGPYPCKHVCIPFLKPQKFHALWLGAFSLTLGHGYVFAEADDKLMIMQSEMTLRRDGCGAETIDAPESSQVRLHSHDDCVLHSHGDRVLHSHDDYVFAISPVAYI
jgi:hypothetical protein